MIRSKIYTALLILLIAITGCVQESADPDNALLLRPLTAEEEILLHSSNEFSFELLRMLHQIKPEENSLFSALGVGNGIGMSFNLLEKKPKDELKSFLKIDAVRDIEIHKAYFQLSELLNLIDYNIQYMNSNSLWVNRNMELNEYAEDKIMAYYDADLNYLDFSSDKSIKKINTWAEKRTFGKIKTIVSNLDPSDKSFIANCLFFDINRALPFEQIDYQDLSFTTIDGDYINCKGIGMVSGDFNYFENEDYQIVDIPIGKKQFYLTLIMPYKLGGIHKMITEFTPELLQNYLNQTIEINESLLIPDIEIDSEIRLKSLFPNFGLTGPLRINSDFYLNGNIDISDFIHKSHFSIGMDQYDDTQKSINPDIQPVLSEPILFNQPFIFIVRERFTGAITFTGKMVKPVRYSSSK